MTCQIYGNSSQTVLGVGKQSACGTPNTTLSLLRTTGNTLEQNSTATESQEIRSDRNVSDLVRTKSTVGGPITGELSYTTWNKLLGGVLQSSAEIDGAGTVIKNGVTPHYFTVEKNTPVNGTNYYTQYTDVQIDEITVTIPTQEKVTISATTLGSAAVVVSSSPLGSGYTAVTSTPVYNSNYHVKSITINGVTTYKVQSLNWTYKNNLAEQAAVGDVIAGGVSSGEFQVTGSIAIFFKDNALLSAFLADTAFSMSVVLDDKTGVVNGNELTFNFPHCKFATISTPISGNNNALVQTCTFQAIYDSATTSTTSIAGLDKADT